MKVVPDDDAEVYGVDENNNKTAEVEQLIVIEKSKERKAEIAKLKGS